jgi:hypothetical protein
MPLTEKQKIELATAKMFLSLYNPEKTTAFEVLKQGDAPDILCRDAQTNEDLALEITLLEDLPGEIKYLRGKGIQPNSKITGTPVRSFFDDVAPQLAKALEGKMLSVYGSKTALVIRQISPIWGTDDWQRIKENIIKEVFRGRELNFGAGIWIICVNGSTWPASNTLFCLSPGKGNSVYELPNG